MTISYIPGHMSPPHTHTNTHTHVTTLAPPTHPHPHTNDYISQSLPPIKLWAPPPVPPAPLPPPSSPLPPPSLWAPPPVPSYPLPPYPYQVFGFLLLRHPPVYQGQPNHSMQHHTCTGGGGAGGTGRCDHAQQSVTSRCDHVQQSVTSWGHTSAPQVDAGEGQV